MVTSKKNLLENYWYLNRNTWHFKQMIIVNKFLKMS